MTEEAQGWIEHHAAVLTDRQLQVARLLAAGKSVADAAAALGVGRKCVHEHVRLARRRVLADRAGQRREG